jgi:cytosine/adenosine deaminase-related metal-dependent hydrolase
VGKDADIILLRTDLLNVAPINDAAGAVVHAMDGSNVDTILVAGNPVKVGGKIVGLDVTAIIDAAGKARDRAVERSGFSKPLVN